MIQGYSDFSVCWHFAQHIFIGSPLHCIYNPDTNHKKRAQCSALERKASLM